MSPAWSPDGQYLAYVSFEKENSSVFVQNVRTGQRNEVAAHKGINSAPSFSPDGQRLAMTLSKEATRKSLCCTCPVMFCSVYPQPGHRYGAELVPG